MPPNESAQKSAAKPGAGDGVVLDRPDGNWAPRGASGQVCRAPWGARLIAYTGLMDMGHQGAMGSSWTGPNANLGSEGS